MDGHHSETKKSFGIVSDAFQTEKLSVLMELIWEQMNQMVVETDTASIWYLWLETQSMLQRPDVWNHTNQKERFDKFVVKFKVWIKNTLLNHIYKQLS
jgi:hypothetical protein